MAVLFVYIVQTVAHIQTVQRIGVVRVPETSFFAEKSVAGGLPFAAEHSIL